MLNKSNILTHNVNIDEQKLQEYLNGLDIDNLFALYLNHNY